MAFPLIAIAVFPLFIPLLIEVPVLFFFLLIVFIIQSIIID
jgi:hypothetical protein